MSQPIFFCFQSTAEDGSSSSDDDSDISGIDDIPDIMLDEDAKYEGQSCTTFYTF